MDGREEVVRFNSILTDVEKRLGGKWQLVDCSGRMQWPKRGVCFFFDTKIVVSVPEQVQELFGVAKGTRYPILNPSLEGKVGFYES
jgi:hypothetical protein